MSEGLSVQIFIWTKNLSTWFKSKTLTTQKRLKVVLAISSSISVETYCAMDTQKELLNYCSASNAFSIFNMNPYHNETT